MCQFLDIRKRRYHKNNIREIVRVLGLPTNTRVANNAATLLSGSANLISGSWDPGIKEEGGETRHVPQTFLDSCLSLPGAPLLTSNALEQLYGDPPQTCSISPWASSISITSSFFAQARLVFPFGSWKAISLN